MSLPWRRRGNPSPFKTLIDAAILIVLLVAALVAARQSGVMDLAAGLYQAADGDSLRRDGTSVRLYGIDAPELAQLCRDGRGLDYPCGREAMKALAGLIRGRDIACTMLDQDRYGRAVALCKAGEIDINGEMVRLGWALAYRRHSSTYVNYENEARKARRGIWQGRFESPETWRERNPRED